MKKPNFSYSEASDWINKLIDSSTLSFNPSEGNIESFNNKIAFVEKENIQVYKKLFIQLYHSNEKIFKSFSKELFNSHLVELIYSLKSQNKRYSEGKCRHFFKGLIKINMEEKEFSMFYKLNGALLNVMNLDLGPYTLYNYALAKEHLVEQYPEFDNDARSIFSDNESTSNLILISIKVKVKDEKLVKVEADRMISKFDNILSYMLSTCNKPSSIGVLLFKTNESIRRLKCFKNRTYIGGQNNLVDLYDLKSDFFNSINPPYGNGKIWKIINNPDKNEIETRLINGIEWIGKAVRDADKSKALTQVIIAIEAVLRFGGSSKEIIAHYLKWILEPNSETSRDSIEQEFIICYVKRNNVTHEGMSETDEFYYKTSLSYAQRLIFALLTEEKYKSIENMQQLESLLPQLTPGVLQSNQFKEDLFKISKI